MSRDGLRPAMALLGDSAVMITFGEGVDRELNRAVHSCAAAVREAALPGVVDVVPAYSSLAVHYDALVVDADEITNALRGILAADALPAHDAESRLVTIPVRYDGVDLAAVAEAVGLTVEQVIEKHHAVEYSVYALGFSPGFAYLGDLDSALRLPRRKTPRTRVPPGSVAIAGSQTAVYPHQTPGGWHLVGSTPLAMFDVARQPPALLRAGDRVRFERIA